MLFSSLLLNNLNRNRLLTAYLHRPIVRNCSNYIEQLSCTPPSSTASHRNRIHKVLVANRGEIACRLITSAHRLGISTVAVYSDTDASSLHSRLANEAYYIGGPEAATSYLDMNRIVETALKSNCNAIHPGYGFLSQHPELATLCAENGLIWVGPSAYAIKTMGIKSFAKDIMSKADVPVIPGYHGTNQEDEFLCSQAEAIGYPVMVKPTRGGGGKGMRVIHNSKDFMQSIQSIKRESLKSFGSEEVLIEKYIKNPRHIEVQVLCDNYNNAVYLYERDCSIQRRHQKIIEEAPAPNMPVSIREKLGQAAVNAAKAVNYSNAGTVEFVMDADGQFYFMEMNTRLQVEHPVTEMVTKTNLVELQYRIASGEKLPFSQQEIPLEGHSFEARIYAEDPNNNFLPCTGNIEYLNFPTCDNTTVRVDTGIEQGDAISSYFDPMIAKLITWGKDRNEALDRMKAALKQCQIVGLPNNISFLNRVLSEDSFVNCNFTTSYIDQNPHLLNADNNSPSLETIAMAVICHYRSSFKENGELTNFRLNSYRSETLIVKAGNNTDECKVTVSWIGPDTATFKLGDKTASFKFNFIDNSLNLLDQEMNRLSKCQFYNSSHDGSVSIFREQPDQSQLTSDDTSPPNSSKQNNTQFKFKVLSERNYDSTNSSNSQTGAAGNTTSRVLEDGRIASDLNSPMDGTVVKIDCQLNQKVTAGDVLVTVEAMKMEHSILAPYDGIVCEIFINEKMSVGRDQQLLTITKQVE